MEKIKITEEQGVHKQWYLDAKSQTMDTLPDFLNNLMNGYQHDYGTICHALTAGAIATASAMNKHRNGGITGFQAGAIMWQFIREWNHSDNKTGMKIVDYDKMLYPQYWDSYEKTISKSTFEALQKQATINIQEADDKYADYLKAKAKYDIDIAEYVEKYPDYYQRKEHYDRRLSGTGSEWEAEKIKEESGFDFAPQEPYVGVTNESPVYVHWVSIVNGVIPFGHIIKD